MKLSELMNKRIPTLSFEVFPPKTTDGYESVEKAILKNVLGEVLRDLRKQNKCYVKYEVKQRCFHITTRM